MRRPELKGCEILEQAFIRLIFPCYRKPPIYNEDVIRGALVDPVSLSSSCLECLCLLAQRVGMACHWQTHQPSASLAQNTEQGRVESNHRNCLRISIRSYNVTSVSGTSR